MKTDKAKSSSSDKQPSLMINAVSNWVALAINVLVGLFLTPFIIKHLGKTGYGIWTLIGAIVGYYGLMNLGVTSAVLRYIARYAGRKDYRVLNETLNTSLAMFCITGVIAIIMSVLLAKPLAHFFDIIAEERAAFVLVIIILGITTGVSFPGSVFAAALKAHEKFVVSNFVSIARTVSQAALTVFFLLNGKGILGVAYSNLIVTLGQTLVQIVLCLKLLPHIQIGFSMARRNVLKSLITYGAAAMVIAVSDLLRFNLDSFVIAKWDKITSVAVYGIAALIIRYMLMVIATGLGVLAPRFAKLDGAGEKKRVQTLFLKAMSISAVLGFGICMLAIVFGWQFIKLWVGSDFEGAVLPLWILAVAYAFALSQNPAVRILYAINKHRFFAVASVAEGLANLAISIILVQFYGIVGVAIGTAIPMLFIKVIVQPIYVSRAIDISLTDYIKPLVAPCATGVIMTILGVFCEKAIGLPDLTVFQSAMFVLIASLLFIAGSIGGACLLRLPIPLLDETRYSKRLVALFNKSFRFGRAR